MATRRVKGRKGRKTRRQRGGLNFGKLKGELGALRRGFTPNFLKTNNQKAVIQLDKKLDEAIAIVDTNKKLTAFARDYLINEGGKGTHMVLNHWKKNRLISDKEYDLFKKKIEFINSMTNLYNPNRKTK
jgi:hypothetical protein